MIGKPRRSGACGRGGFTVLEVLVALAIVGVAVSVFISFYRLSLTLLDNSRGETVSAHLAEEHLARIVAQPEALDWSGFWSAPVGERHRLTTLATAETPAAVPTEVRAFNQTKNQYEDCIWEAFARLPNPDAAYVEISVEVRWTLEHRERLFVLTSCVPRERVEGAA